MNLQLLRHDFATTERLTYLVDNEWRPSKTAKYMPVMDPSTGKQIAEAPCCTQEEVDSAVAAAARAFPGWRDTPIPTRVQLMFRFKQLLDAHLDELTELVATENGKVLDEARGDVLKAIEVVECACSTHYLMQGDSCMNVSTGYDTVTYREPLGVFAGIAPFNFPAMIPFGWMIPLAIATGNTFVLKAATMVPQTAMRMLDLLIEAGLPKGVVNMVTCRGTRPKPAGQPRRQRRQLRRLDLGRQAHLPHRRRRRQTRPGAHRSQEPRARARGLRARAVGPRHHQLDLRLRRPALHGAAGGLRAGVDRRRVRRATEEVRPGAEHRPRLLPTAQLGPVVSAAQKESVEKAIARASKRAPSWCSTAAASSCPATRAATSSVRPSSITSSPACPSARKRSSAR